MASIQKRGKKFAVVYSYEDKDGTKRQKWETFTTKKAAAGRKAEVENEKNKGTFLPPVETTLRNFLQEFVEVYGSKRWGLSVFTSNTALIEHYINPFLGDLNVQDISRRVIDSFVLNLQNTAPVSTSYRRAQTEFLTPCSIEKIMKLLHCAFRQAVRWDLIPKNPCTDVLLPKREKNSAKFGPQTLFAKL